VQGLLLRSGICAETKATGHRIHISMPENRTVIGDTEVWSHFDSLEIVRIQESCIDMPENKPPECRIHTGEFGQARQTIPMIGQNSSLGFAVALSNRTLVALSKFPEGVNYRMAEEECPKHNVPLKLRRNVKTGELALACPFCDAEQPPKNARQIGSGARQTRPLQISIELIINGVARAIREEFKLGILSVMGMFHQLTLPKQPTVLSYIAS
jgi:hypothetical protein